MYYFREFFKTPQFRLQNKPEHNRNNISFRETMRNVVAVHEIMLNIASVRAFTETVVPEKKLYFRSR